MARRKPRTLNFANTKPRFARSARLGLAVLLVLMASARLVGADPSTPLVIADPGARLLKGNAASEHWEITIRLDSGHWILARFVVTDFGPGERNAVVLGHVVRPDGREVIFSNGRTRSHWDLSDDRRSLDIGSSHLDLHQPKYRLLIDKEKASVDLRFAPQALPSPGPGTLPEGYGLEILALGAPLEGTLQLPDMPQAREVSGYISVVHTWMSQEESLFAARRTEFHSLGEDALYVLEVAGPDGRGWNWLVARNAGSQPQSLAGFKADHEGTLPGLSRPKYHVPAGIEWSGPCLEGFVALSRPFLETDPLVFLPQPIRWLVGLKMKPHRVWATSGFDVTLRGCSNRPPIKMLGTGITALTFMHP